MRVNSFEEIIAWKKARILVVDIYKYFEKCRDYSFKDQLFRAVVSISNNIAEGFEKDSDKDFVKYLYISKGSCGEVRSMLYLAKDLGYVSEEKFNSYYVQTIEIAKILGGFIKFLKK